ncbi:MAG: hypothetical protein QHJ73_05065 [Armatimonadota bacterium]|nr:hypothetical protein [Armatimonadota bacterium]
MRTSEPLYLLTYDHGGLVLWGIEHFLERLRDAVAWLDRYPTFKIGLENEGHTYDELARSYPEVLAELRGYLQRYRGRLGIGTCTYGQPLSTFINEESNIRQLGSARRACIEHLGCAPNVYLMSEHAMHAQMPQLLAGFGFEGAILRTHYMMYGYNPTFAVPVGWWVGLDGSRVPAIPTYPGEGAQFGRTTIDNWILTRYPGPECETSLEEFRARFAHIQPLLASRADDSGLRREALVREVEGNPAYRWVLLEEVFPAFPQPKAEMRTGANDFTTRMPWGYCGNEIWNLSRQAEVSVLTAERLAALELLLGGADHEADLRPAWDDLLTAQHHDIQICGLLADARRFLPRSIAASSRVTHASLRAVGERMQSAGAAQVTAFNPLSWRRKEWVEVALSLPRGAARAVGVRHGESAAPSAVLSADRHSDGSLRDVRLAFQADLPGLAVQAYSVVPEEPASRRPAPGIEVDPARLFIRTPLLEAHLHPSGGIASLRDAATGAPLLRGERSAFFAGRIDGAECESRGVWTVEPGRDGAPWAAARESGVLGTIPYLLEIRFWADTPRLDCRVTFQFSGQRIGRLSDNVRDSVSGFTHQEKLRFKVYPAVGREELLGVRDLPFAVAETRVAERPYYLEGNYWTAVATPQGGTAVFNRGTMGSVWEEDDGFSVPLAFAMYYIWGTRMLYGSCTYEFALYPFRGAWGGNDLHRRALEYNYPVVAAMTPRGNGLLGAEVRVVDVDSADVLLSALYGAGGQVYARLYEHRGAKGEAEVGGGPFCLTEVNLAGTELGPVSARLTFRPWQIRTIRLDPARGG